MGTWGEGPFDNDDALDWIDELGEAAADERVALVRRAFRDVGRAAGTDGDGEDGPGVVVAAAAVVASGLPGGPSFADDEDVSEALDGLVLPPDLVAPAREALTRVVRESEWRELWEEVDGLDAALEAMRPVLDALGVDTGPP